MTHDQLNQARDRDLPASLAATHRAALAAREQAVRTNTAIVVFRGGVPVRITAEELRAAGIRRALITHAGPSSAGSACAPPRPTA